jgi:hypothetical protein
MPREIDERKKRKALRKLRKAAMLAEQGLGPPLSEWEVQFLEEVEARIEEFGSAFADPEKGGADEPLSALQALKLREIDKKARGKGKGGFKSKKPMARKSYGRQLNEDLEPEAAPPPKRGKPKLVKARDMIEGDEGASQPTAPLQTPPQRSTPRPSGRPVFRVIEGGAADDD